MRNDGKLCSQQDNAASPAQGCIRISDDESTDNPELIKKAVDGMKQLSESDLLLLLSMINRLQK